MKNPEFRRIMEDVLQKQLLQKQQEEVVEPKTSPETIANERAFLSSWTGKGKKLIQSAGGNFYMAGGNRKHCTIMKPRLIADLLEAGVIEQAIPGRPIYRFMPEQKAGK